MTEVMKWYGSLVGGSSVNAVAEKAGLVQSTLARQVKAESLSPETVVAIARAYGDDVLDALVLTGLISETDIQRHGIKATLSDAFDADLTAEILRRLGSGDHPILDAPLG